MGWTLRDPFREVNGLWRYNIVTKVLHWRSFVPPNKAMDIGEWSICGGDRLHRFYCKRITHIRIHVHTDTYIHILCV